MASDREFYLARAEECATEAAAAKLDNVRERALRSEAAWRVMADRQARIAVQRAVVDAERRDRQAAEAERAREHVATLDAGSETA